MSASVLMAGLFVSTAINVFGTIATMEPKLDDPAMVDSSGNWVVWLSGSGYQMADPWQPGVSGTPVATDFDGDRHTDCVMVDSNGAWWVWFSGLGYQMAGMWNSGVSGMPVAADFDGDRHADPAMVDSAGNWFVWLSRSGYQPAGPWQPGVSGTPVAADFDGDRYGDPAMVDCSGNWFFWFSRSGYQPAGQWQPGVSGTPVAADFDGDRYGDPAMVDCSGNWFFWFSGSSYQPGGTWQPGVTGTPIAADFDNQNPAANTTVRYANAWVYLPEDEPSGTTYSDPNSCWQHIPYDKVDMLFIGFGFTSLDTNRVPTFSLLDPNGPSRYQHDLNNLTNVVWSARQQNPNIKIFISLDWAEDGSQLANIFVNNNAYVNKYAQDVANFVINYNLNGFDIDYESVTINNSQFTNLAANIRQELNKRGDFLFTLSPATTTALDATTINNNIDYLNLQTYYNSTWLIGQFTGMGISTNKLIYGVCTETGYWDNVPEGYNTAVNDGLAGVFNWRLNSDNWLVSTNKSPPAGTPGEIPAQTNLYQLVHPSP